jgi:hypothetical protein
MTINGLAADYRNGERLCQTNDGVIWSVVRSPWSVAQIGQVVQVVETVEVFKSS